jgi:hypothetical protein
MGADGVFPPEMPDTPYDPAERLPGGRLDPEDAPPGYAEVARVLRAAAGPPCPDELADSRPPWPRSTGSATAPGFAPAWSPWPSPGPWPSGACGSPTAPIPRLGHCPPPGGPAAAGRGQGRPLARRGRVGPGRLRQARVGPGRHRRCGRRCRRLGRLRGRAVGRRSCPRPVSGRSPAHGGGGASRGGGSARGVRPATSSRGPTAKPPKPFRAEPGKAEPGRAKLGKAGEAGRGGGGEGR